MSNKTLNKVTKICKEQGFTFIKIEPSKNNSYIYYIDCNGNTTRKRRDHFLEAFGKEYIDRIGSKYNKQILQNDPRVKPTVLILGEFESLDTKILCQCTKCGNQWLVTPNKLIQGRACPLCKGDATKEKRTKTDKEFKQELLDKNIPYINCEPYINAKTSIGFYCLKCGYTFKACPTNILRGLVGCTKCAASLGENKIIESLKELKIKFITQKTFEGCVYKGKLRFDFYLPQYNTCIEFQGEQHYKPIAFHREEYGYEDKLFIELLERDKIKKDFCNKNNIKLIIIPYTERENINPNFIKQLLSK